MLNKLGLSTDLRELVDSKSVDENELARVVAVHQDLYVVQNGISTFKAEITGNLRYSSTTNLDFPTVGDWVKIIQMDDDNAIIIEVFDRSSVLQREDADFGEFQLIAANIDVAFIVKSASQDFNMSFLDQYIAISKSAMIEPIVILSKIDSMEYAEVLALKESIIEHNPGIKVLLLSYELSDSFQELISLMEPFKTYCFVGAVGAGKTTIIKHLLGSNDLEVDQINEADSDNEEEGNITNYRELFILQNQSIVIDTLGMREVDLINRSDSNDSFSNSIEALAMNCKFSNCSHTNEKGCAVLKALESGDLSQSEYDSFMRERREESHFSMNEHEKRKADKSFSKKIKKHKNQDNY